MAYNATAIGTINVCNRDSSHGGPFALNDLKTFCNYVHITLLKYSHLKGQKVLSNLQTPYSITVRSLTPTQNKQDLSF